MTKSFADREPCVPGQLKRMIELSKSLELTSEDWTRILATYGVRRREALSRYQADALLGRLQCRIDTKVGTTYGEGK